MLIYYLFEYNVIVIIKEFIMRKVLVSGVQTSGHLTMGNYLGAIKNWVNLVNDYDSYIFLADLHSLTIAANRPFILDMTYEITALYLACGLDPHKTCLFAQSSIDMHSEFSWILSCVTPLGWLNRMIQFKEKAGSDQSASCLGLYSYPVLQTADILLYHADIVPVGEDQKQHIELARDIAASFNRFVDKDYFKLPECVIMKENARVMSLRDGRKKMSKSDPSDQSRINMLDDNDTISRKIMKATSDSMPHISYDIENRPEISNLLGIHSAFSGKSIVSIVDDFVNKGTADFKRELALLIVENLGPIRNKALDYIKNKDYLNQVLKEGREKASNKAYETYKVVKDLVGLINTNSHC